MGEEATSFPRAKSTSKSKDYAQAIVNTIREPLLVLDEDLQVISANESFYGCFGLTLQKIENKKIINQGEAWELPELEQKLITVLQSENPLKDYHINLNNCHGEPGSYAINANILKRKKKARKLLLISFKDITDFIKERKREKDYIKSFQTIISQAPAMICTLKGPDHVFEVANSKYLQLIGNRDIIGKSVKDALPEVESQGFIDILNEVYTSGKPFLGNEIEIKLDKGNGSVEQKFLDFVYQPIRNEYANIDGIFVHVIDVTEQVKARKKIEENELHLQNLIDAVPAIIWIANKDGESIYLNKNWFKYTGQRAEDAKGFGWLDALHPDDREKTRQSFYKAHKNQMAYSVSFRLKNLEGGYRWVMDKGSPKYDSEGNYEGLIGTVIDVHEEKIKEQLIREKEHRIQSIVEQATVASAVYTGREMKIEFANDAMFKLWDKDRSVLGKTLRKALPELEGQPFHDLLDNVYTTGEVYWGKEDRVDLKIGGKMQTGYYNFTYKPLRNEDGAIYGILNMAIDVTEMVQSKMMLKESETHFRQVADLMPGKVISTDASGNGDYFNQNWLEYTGLSSKDLKQHGWMRFIHLDDRELFNEKWSESQQEGKDFEMELRLLNSAGKYQWHLSRAEAVRDEKGNIKMWISTNTEIQKLKEEEKRKEDFLKMVSHELKTPVTSIKGYVQLLLSMANKESETLKAAKIPLKPSLKRIDNQITRLTRLISEILDISRIEENKLELQLEKFNLNELVSETVQDINYTNTQHTIKILNKIDCKVIADRDRIGQVLINFITNAIKYSPDSQEIEVSVSRKQENKVMVSVKDYGIGIDKAFHKNIFRRFYRVGVKSEETYSGFGIGLFLAREIIQRHHGLIDVKSEPGVGSEFSFILDIAE